MEIKPILTKADHGAALKEVEGLMSAGKGSRNGERLDVLETLIEAYERKHLPMELPDPIEAIRFSMEQKRLTAKYLVPMIGQINRVYEAPIKYLQNNNFMRGNLRDRPFFRICHSATPRSLGQTAKTKEKSSHRRQVLFLARVGTRLSSRAARFDC